MAIAAGHSARVLLVTLLAIGATAAADDAFLTAALAAGGADDPCEAEQWRQVYAELRSTIVTGELAALPEPERLAALQRALHERILIGSYQPAASDLRRVLASGDYNCLSAAVLFFDLARAAGSELEIWSRPGHVWLQSAAGMVIEPAAGVNSPSAGTPSLAHRVGVVRQVTPRELLGKFYYNRGVPLLHGGQYAAGLALMRQALAHDPGDSEARENLLAGINNWAAEHLRAKRFRQAAELIRQGLAVEPAYGPLVANQRLLP